MAVVMGMVYRLPLSFATSAETRNLLTCSTMATHLRKIFRIPFPMPPTKLTKAPEEKPLGLADAMETVWHKTVQHIYPVSDSQLDELTAGYNSLYLVFLGICLGGVISLGITYPQITNATQKPYYFAALLVSIFFAFFFAIAGIGRYTRASSAKKRLKHSVPLEPPSS